MLNCSHCGASLETGRLVCPACGASTSQQRVDEETRAFPEEADPIDPVMGSRDRLLGTLAYFTFLPALIFLVATPFRKSRYVRFHSLQSILVAIIVFVVFAALAFAQPVGQLIVLLIAALSLLFFGILWIVLIIEAWRGIAFRLPVLGTFAARQAAR